MKNQYFDEYFYLKKSERRGVLLFFICSVSCVILFKIISGSKVQISVENTGMSKASDYSLLTRPKTLTFKSVHSEKHKKQSKKTTEVFDFNPNTLPQDSFTLLGFSTFCAKNIIRYREKGGQFKNVQQLSKIFGIDTSLLSTVQPYIHFGKPEAPEVKQDKEKYTSQSNNASSGLTSDQEIQIDVNQADSSALVSIKGIGPYYAKKILAFRRKIGGIFRPEQLVECKVIPDSTWAKIAKNFVAQPNEELKININKAGYKELIQHPYLEENLVKVILQYRKNHGDFANPEQLKNIKILTPEIYNKILPHFRY